MMNRNFEKFRLFACMGLLGLIAAGITLRFTKITQNQFFYYDEGLYLEHNIDFLYYLQHHPPDTLKQLGRYLQVSAHMALADTKVLWFFLCDLRAYLVGADAWYFTRLLSAIFGSLTVLVLYRFARRFYDSRWVGLFSAALLSIFPSHLYYSRLGMQEALSTLCFMTGLYFYLFPRKLHVKTFLSGAFFAGVFFTNYRMIFIPFLVLFCELWDSLARRERSDIRKYIYNTLTFLCLVFFIGNIDQGANTKITFAWMFYQSHLAQRHFELFNLLAYPYYLFRLDGILFGALFFGNFYYVWKRQWSKLLPFALTCLLMLVFSFPQEKGARYICSVMPLMVAAAASLIVCLWEQNTKPVARWILGSVVFLTMFSFSVKSYEIIRFSSDYEASARDLVKINSDVKFLSTQPLVQKLYVVDRRNVAAVPHQWEMLLMLFAKGYRYVVIDPQAYISYTQDGRRFSPPLKNFLEFITRNVRPYQVYPHFNKALLERFVLEHNEDLKRSMAFLQTNQDGQLGALRVYDIRDCILALKNALRK